MPITSALGRAEWAVGFLRHRLDWQTQAPADDRSDVAYRIALVGYGVPGRPGRCLLEGKRWIGMALNSPGLSWGNSDARGNWFKAASADYEGPRE